MSEEIAGENSEEAPETTPRETRRPLWFDEPVLGEMSRTELENRLWAIGEPVEEGVREAVDPEALRLLGIERWGRWLRRPWAHAGHIFGFIPPVPPGGNAERTVVLQAATGPEAMVDATLRGKRVKITLDRLRIAEYPGRGEHTVLFEFSAQNQSAKSDGVEQLHFNSLYQCRDGETAAVQSRPIFVGLRVGPNGVMFGCRTVNVKSSGDRGLLDFLESDAFQQGLRLLNVAQPALAPLSGMAQGLTKNLARRSENVPVQKFELGLDFGSSATGARLQLGSFVAIQMPPDRLKGWEWKDYQYDRDIGQVIGPKGEHLDLNYIVFAVTEFAEEDPA